MVVCLEQSANDLHTVQLMPLPPHRLLLRYHGSAFLLLAYPVVLEKVPLNECTVLFLLHTQSQALKSEIKKLNGIEPKLPPPKKKIPIARPCGYFSIGHLQIQTLKKTFGTTKEPNMTAATGTVSE